MKTELKLAKYTWISSMILWVVETVGFLIYEGWHIEATHNLEIALDKTVSFMITLALMFLILALYKFLLRVSNADIVFSTKKPISSIDAKEILDNAFEAERNKP